ncbi:hypothetical protein KIW84_022602 [Lathyrus oleraceus]|uniref:Retrotransposon gag domain-containing protein n=1 Tax=Pisum sativum TaxID=3888 RepID=A0A9D4YBL0_PEA|nr:hypothetical protein KIW84_022602 [Pisum sativum]
MPQPFVAWKKIVDHLVLEKTQMMASFETEISKLTHRYNTRANHLKIMEHIEQENRELKDGITRLTAMMESVLAAQSQASPTPATPPPQRTVISEVATSTMPASAAHFAPAGFPWGIPPKVMPEGFAPTFSSMPASSPVMSVPPPVVHTLPRVEDTIYHSESSKGPDVYEKMDETKDQFLELCKELKTLRGKDLFGKSVVELCLVPNVKIPVKLKVPNFEKHKGNTCPLIHLVMYARKMSTQTDNDQLLIHYFQDSLTGAALRWYMGLDSASIRTFNDVGEAFVKQYKYNVDMAPDRDQLSSPSDFTEMVNMGMRLEEGVREGRLSKEEASSNKRYGNIFGKKKDNEANAISSGRQRRPRIRRNQPSRQHHHQVSSFIPVFSNNQSTPVQQQQRQQQQPQQRTNTYNNSNTNNNYHQQNFERKKVSFDPIPMSYAELYKSLVLKTLLQPRNPPQIPEPLPWWYKPELHCAFHQGAPGHDIENSYPLKYEVQKLMKSGVVSFEDRMPNVKAIHYPPMGILL